MVLRGSFELVFGAHLHSRTQGVFEVRVEPIIRIELRAVAGQVKHLDLCLVLSQPRLDRLAMVHPQVVQDQKHLLARTLDQQLQEFDQLV